MGGHMHQQVICDWKEDIQCRFEPITDDECKARYRLATQKPAIFYEDFSYPTLTTNWSLKIWPNKTANFTSESAFVRNGLLHIQTGQHYIIGSKDSYSFAEIEIRAKIAVYRNHRLKNSAEASFGFAADYCADRSSHYSCYPHIGFDQFSNKIKPSIISNTGEDVEKDTAILTNLDSFHVFKVKWSRRNVIWYVDDVEIRRQTAPDIIPSGPLNVVIEGYDLISETDAFDYYDRNAGLLIDYIIIRQQPLNHSAGVRPQPPDHSASVRSQPLNHMDSVRQEPLNRSGSVRPQPLNLSTSVREERLNHSASARPQPLNHSASVRQQPLEHSASALHWPWEIPTVIVLITALCIGLAVILWRKRRQREFFGRTSVLAYLPLMTRSATKEFVNNLYRAWKIPPHVSALQIPRQAIKIEYKLDEGEFGIIWKATAYKLRLFDFRTPCAVAVKRAKHYTDEYHHRLLMEEVTVHSQAGRHLNVVSLLGIVLSGQLHIILEYSRYGNLLNYLRDLVKRHGPNNIGHESFSENEVGDSIELHQISGVPANLPLTVEEMTTFAYQISLGLDYLAHKNIIHMDFAARNVLVYEKQILKIEDFGLAKQKSDYYRMTNSEHATFPIKWMAPESIEEGIYSEKSDVWSFGIVVWEIFTLGKVPYFDTFKTLAPLELKSALQEGLRMLMPAYCPQSLGAVVNTCWSLSATDRPTFTGISRQIEPLVAPEIQRHYVELNKPYVKFNARSSELVGDESVSTVE